MIGVVWVGADGSVWDLSAGPVVLQQSGVDGFGQPKWDRQVITSAGRDGQRRTLQRSRAEPRDGLLPVVLSAADMDSWLTLSRAWWNSWSPDVAGSLKVTAPDGRTRQIAAFLSDDNAYAPAFDPSIRAVELVAVTWIADDPWWRGSPRTFLFTVGSGAADFFNGGAAPPFIIVDSSTVATATISNTGDLDAWPTYTITGPATDFSITVDGHIVSGTITVATGETLTIDTDPAVQTAILTHADGSTSNVTPQLTGIDFASILPGESIPLTVTLDGTGSLLVTVTPRFVRAW